MPEEHRRPKSDSVKLQRAQLPSEHENPASFVIYLFRLEMFHQDDDHRKDYQRNVQVAPERHVEDHGDHRVEVDWTRVGQFIVEVDEIPGRLLPPHVVDHQVAASKIVQQVVVVRIGLVDQLPEHNECGHPQKERKASQHKTHYEVPIKANQKRLFVDRYNKRTERLCVGRVKEFLVEVVRFLAARAL
jgi:hypothetical protein